MEDEVERIFSEMKLMQRESQVYSANVSWDRDVGHFGYTALFLGLTCMVLSTLYFMSLAFNKEGGYRKIEGISALITGIASIFYLIMFSGSGKLYEEAFDNNGYTANPIFWARYVDWIVTTPLMILDVLTIAGASKDGIMFTSGVDVLMITFGVVGAFTTSASKWIFFILAMLCFGHIVMVLLQHMKFKKYGTAANKLYAKATYLTIVVWTCYPLVWLLCEGSRAFNTQYEICAYMLLDVSSKCIFGYIIVTERNALTAIHAAEAGYNQIEAVEEPVTAG